MARSKPEVYASVLRALLDGKEKGVTKIMYQSNVNSITVRKHLALAIQREEVKENNTGVGPKYALTGKGFEWYQVFRQYQKFSGPIEKALICEQRIPTSELMKRIQR